MFVIEQMGNCENCMCSSEELENMEKHLEKIQNRYYMEKNRSRHLGKGWHYSPVISRTYYNNIYTSLQLPMMVNII